MKLFIGVCNSQDFVPAGFFWTFQGIKKPWPIQMYRSTHPWDVVRNNQIIYQFLKSDCDVLVKMDIDQSYPETYFEKFVPLVQKFKAVGPLIYDRCDANRYMPLAFSAYYEGGAMKKMNLSDKVGVIEVPYAHTNLFYAREVLEKISPPWYEAYATQDGLARKNHVDFTFIDKIHAAGYKTYIDLGMIVGHMHVVFEMGQE